MKTLIITEKPSVAMDIARVLGGFERKDGYLEKSEMIISWAVGHLVELAKPQDYDPALEKWNIDDLPILPKRFQLKPKPATRGQLNILKTLINRKDVVSLVNACDAGREGELIFRYIIEYLNCSKPHQRLWLSETTDAAIRTAFSNLRDGQSMNSLSDSAKARSRADWIVGINATRGYTVKHNDKITVGRVQTPTLAILVKRQDDITNFTPTPYFEVHGEFLSGDIRYNGQYYKTVDDKAVTRLETKAEAEIIVNKVTGQPAVITDITEQNITQHPPQLYNLNDLQKDANKKYGYTAAETLAIAQKLYESKYITYPRTDSRHLTVEMAATMPNRLNSLRATDMAPLLGGATVDISSNKKYVDNSKVTDHTAIIITDQAVDLTALSEKEQKIYWLVAKRTLAIFYPPAQFKKTKITTTVADETFLTNAREVIELGWRVVLSQEEDNDNELPAISLTQGDTAVLTAAEIKECETKPPRLLTESDLLAQMEKSNLGTPATRASIIEKLINTGYVMREKKNLIPTAKGLTVIKEIVSPTLADVDLTAQWEIKLEEIAQGKYTLDAFMSEIEEFTKKIISEIRAQEIILTPQPDSLGSCPLCGKPVIENKKAYGCSGWKDGCKFVIWKKIAGKSITKEQVKKLLSAGKTGLIKGFKSKKGTTFDAHLKIEGSNISFDFPPKTVNK